MRETPIAILGRDAYGSTTPTGRPPHQMMTPCPAMPGGAFFMAR